MCEGITHEVASPLQLFDLEKLGFGKFLGTNDDSYKGYCRLLRSYSRVAWQHHDCDFCDEPISPGDMYDGWVHVEVESGRKRFYVVRKHYPECPKDLRNMEEEMYCEWEREERRNHREAA